MDRRRFLSAGAGAAFSPLLAADLKSGEGNPMPNQSTGYVFQCPGGVEKIKAWILAGAPACGAVDGDPSPDPALVVGGYSSRHPGGANFVFGDGSVKFIKESIDLATFRALGTRRGKEVVNADSY